MPFCSHSRYNVSALVEQSPPVRSSARHDDRRDWGKGAGAIEALIDDTRCRSLVYETLLLVSPNLDMHEIFCLPLRARTLGRRSTASMGEIYERRWEVKVVNFQPPLSMVVSATENVRDFPL